MIKTTRRELLTAAIGSSWILGGCHSQKAPAPEVALANKLVVVFHGTFAFSFDATKPVSEQLTVVAPLVMNHIYEAGNKLDEKTLPAGGYSLQGVNSGGMPVLDPKKFAMVQRANTGSPAPSNISIKMPFPNKFRGLRNAKPKDATTQQAVNLFQDGTTKLQNNVRPDQVPLLFVATYTSITSPTLVGDNSGPFSWTYVPGKILHIFAEPPQPPSTSHITDALNALNALFSPALNLALTPNLDDTKIQKDMDDEVPNDDQACLSERNGNEGTRIRNCQTLLVT